MSLLEGLMGVVQALISSKKAAPTSAKQHPQQGFIARLNENTDTAEAMVLRDAQIKAAFLESVSMAKESDAGEAKLSGWDHLANVSKLWVEAARAKREKGSTVLNAIEESQCGGDEIKSDQDNRLQRWPALGLALLLCVHAELLHLRDTSPAPQKPAGAKGSTPDYGAPDLLGMNDIKVLTALVEFLVALALLPSLEGGVGTPWKVRLGRAGAGLQLDSNQDNFQSCLTVLVHCLQHDGLKGIVEKKALSDMIAGLLQLGYSPTSKGANVAPTTEGQDNSTGECKLQLDSKDSPKTLVDKVIAASSRNQSQPRLSAREALGQSLLLAVQKAFANPLPVLASVFSLGSGASTASPRWLKRACSVLLAQCLVRKSGVVAVLTLLLQCPEEQRWKHTERAAAMIVSFSPTQSLSLLEYLQAIGKQLIRLIQLNRTTDNGHLIRASGVIISELLIKYPDITSATVLKPLFAPLAVFTEFIENPRKRNVDSSGLAQPLVLENDIEQCVADLFELFVSAAPTATLVTVIQPTVLPLFRVYCVANRTRSHLTSRVKDILTTYFKLLSPAEGAEQFFSLVLPFALPEDAQITAALDGSISVSKFEPVGFAPGPSGGIVLVDCKDTVERDLQHEATLAMELLTSLNRKQLTADVFELLLKEYIKSLPTLNSESESGQGIRLVLLIQVVIEMCEKLGEAIVSDLDQGIRIVAMMIETGTDENIMLSLDLLGVLLGGMVSLSRKDSHVLGQLQGHLHALRNHENEIIKTKAEDISIAIATRSTQWVNTADGEEPSQEDRSALANVLRDLADESVPVRAHGLIELRRLIESKDPSTTRNVSYILGLFESQLGDSDTFMYFAAINGLVSLGDLFPKRVVPVLTRKFRDQTISVENRLKFGEAMMRIARACGDALPHHVNLFIPTILQTIHDPDTTVRASSLSNLATICELLRFSLYTFLEEIVNGVSNIVKRDPSKEVRRGAASVLTSILRGSVHDAFDILGAETLKTLLVLVRHVEDCDPDDVTKYHARIARGQLQEIIKQYMNPGRKMPAGMFLPSDFGH